MRELGWTRRLWRWALVGVAVLGPQATVEYVRVLRDEQIDAYWDNASLPAAASRLFTENEFVRNIAELPWMVPVAFAVGLGIALLTVLAARRGSGGELWALAAASLLASPISWHNYLVVLAPGILLLLAQRRLALGFLLLALQFVPQQRPSLWRGDGTVLAALMLTLYLYVLLAHWLAFLTHGEPGEAAEPVGEKPS